MRYFLSIDYGGTNTKAIIFDDNGKEKAVSSFPTLRIEEIPGFREIDLDKMWESISDSIKTVIKKAGISNQSIVAVSCIGHGKGLYLLDKDNQVFCNGILSTDERAQNLAKSFEAKIDDIWPMTKQHILGMQNPVLLRWLKDNDRDVYDRIGAVLSAKDFIRFKLTNKINQEYGDASSNHWINFETGGYDSKILSFFGIEEMESALPQLVDCSDIVGGISKEAANETGLLEGTPVIGGLFDIDACALGSGVLDSSSFSVIAGTWNINTYPSQHSASQESGQMNSYFPNKDYLIEASSPTSAGNLEIILKMLMSEEIENVKEQGKSIYDDLEIFLENTDSTYTDLIFFPFLYGSNVSADAKSCFFGLSTTTTKSHMLRSVYEGIAFAHKQHIDQLIATKGSLPEMIRLSGGAANSKACVQIFSDIIGLPIETLTASELGGLGGAILAKSALDQVPLQNVVNQMVSVKDIYYPNQEEHLTYNKKYQVYQALIASMENVWHLLNHQGN